MTEKITIIPVAEKDSLYLHYKGQTNPQNCYIVLDCADKTLTAAADGIIGTAVPMDVWHGHTLRYSIPCLRGDSANRLLEEVKPFAERISATYTSTYDGNTWRASYSTDPKDLQAVNGLIRSYSSESDLLVVYDAGDWLCDTVDDLGITAETTNEQLEAMAEELIAQANSDGVDVLDGIEEYLRYHRDRQ